MRAREPDLQGHVEAEGVRIGYESYGEGDTAVVFVTGDVITNVQCWKGQVPWLAQHVRVVTIDPLGNGRSDRSVDRERYGDRAFAGYTARVVEELGINRAVLVGVCVSAWQALVCAALHPERVVGVVAIAPFAKDDTPTLEPRRASVKHFHEPRSSYDGWWKMNEHYWLQDWHDFAQFFFEQICAEPHSSKVVEDMVSYADQTSGEVMVAESGAEVFPATTELAAEMLRSIACPVLVIHGTDDRCQPVGRFDTVVRHTGAERIVLEGSGHLPMGRDPVVVNKAIKAFADRVTGTPAPERRWTRGPARPKRLLYLSSPIGLGHVRRDLAIADEIRKERPDVEVSWLSQSPVTDFLEARGETVHPASRWLASESGHIESESGEHDLHAFGAVRRMDEILVNNFMVFDDLVERESFDLWVGDEAWDLDHFLHENPELKRAPFIWMTDFVGWLPVADADDRERLLTADWNAEMVEHVARYPALRDRSVFVGDPADVVDAPLGPGLPSVRDWTLDHFDFTGYVMGERPQDRAALRRRLGYAEDDVVCLVSVGGSGVGAHLLGKVVTSYDAVRARVPGLRMVVVAGPRIDPASLGAPAGVEVHGFVPDLDLHHAACDVAVVQGGLSTTMELTANGRPFVYFPLGHHFEQQIHVRHRLDRHGAGHALDYRTADAGTIADALVQQLGRTPSYVPVPTDGAARAAQLVVDLI